jgi:hypothetical protein
MKNILTCLALLLLCYSAPAQTLTMDRVPPGAAHAFRAKYQSAQQETWELAGPDIYQVGFFNAKKRQIARFDRSGKWLETETDITNGQIPRAVSAAIIKGFRGFDIQVISEIESPAGLVTYEAVLFKGRENYDIVFSAKGEVLKKEAGQPNE